MPAAIEVRDLDFGYAKQAIFAGLNLELAADQFVAVIGVNGSGKSTFLRLLLGLAKPKRGQIAVLGQRPHSRELRKLLGCALQDIDFPPRLSVLEVLRFACAHHDAPYSIDELVESFSLSEFKDKYCSRLSGGMRRRLALACAFAGKPKILLLDEPSTGLDAASRQRLMQQIHRYRQEHAALVLMISHHPEEVTDFVDSMLLLRPGLAARSVTPEQFRAAAKLRRLEFRSAAQLSFPCAKEMSLVGQRYRIVTDDSDTSVRSLLAQTQDFSDLRIRDLSTQDILEHWL